MSEQPRKPFTPGEAYEKRKKEIPGFVIESFEELIVKNLNTSRYAPVSQEEVILLIGHKMVEHDVAPSMEEARRKIFEYHWLDVEELFAASGWKVSYHKPDPGDSWDPYFTFRGV